MLPCLRHGFSPPFLSMLQLSPLPMLQPPALTPDQKQIQRQAYAGMVWSKQFYHYDVAKWLRGDPDRPVPADLKTVADPSMPGFRGSPQATGALKRASIAREISKLSNFIITP